MICYGSKYRSAFQGFLLIFKGPGSRFGIYQNNGKDPQQWWVQ